MTDQERKYIKARNDIMQAMRSMEELTPQNQKRLMQELGMCTVLNKLNQIIRGY